MIAFEEMREALTDMADNLPDEIFPGLNGGIVLLPEIKYHPKGAGDLYIMGEYKVDPLGLGRYITIYYGSFRAVYGGMDREALLQKVEGVLRHELVHHLESLAGDRSLEIEDARKLARYLSEGGPNRKNT